MLHNGNYTSLRKYFIEINIYTNSNDEQLVLSKINIQAWSKLILRKYKWIFQNSILRIIRNSKLIYSFGQRMFNKEDKVHLKIRKGTSFSGKATSIEDYY